MTFCSLPTELQDVIVGFCWKITFAELLEELETLELIKSWNIDPLFVHRALTKLLGWRSQVTPLQVFEPICDFGGWCRLFDWPMVEEVLFRMDFRKRMVNCRGSRDHWHHLVITDWKEIYCFSEFYKDLLVSHGVPWKPTYIGERIVDFKDFARIVRLGRSL